MTLATPLLLLYGGSDFFAPLRANGKRAYSLAGRPKQLVTLRNGSHTGFGGFANEGSGCGPTDGSDTEAASITTSEPAAGFAGPMRGLFGGAGTREAGMAAAMANCRRMFEADFGPAATPAETNEPSAATEAAGSCMKEV